MHVVCILKAEITLWHLSLSLSSSSFILSLSVFPPLSFPSLFFCCQFLSIYVNSLVLSHSPSHSLPILLLSPLFLSFHLPVSLLFPLLLPPLFLSLFPLPSFSFLQTPRSPTNLKPQTQTNCHTLMYTPPHHASTSSLGSVIFNSKENLPQ